MHSWIVSFFVATQPAPLPQSPTAPAAQSVAPPKAVEETDASLEQPPHLHVGLQLAITAEPDDGGDMSVALNVVPLVVEFSMTRRVGLRATSLVNYQFAGTRSGIAQLGGSLTVPIYLPGRRGESPFQGFYVGPHCGAAINRLYGGADLSPAAEAGFRWRLARRWSLNLATQLGASWLNRPDPENTRWVMHFGVYPSIGVWTF